MDHAAWRAAVGEEFAVPVVDQEGTPAELTLELAVVSDLHVQGGFATYRLEFTGTAAMPLDQGTIVLRHASRGDEVLFVVPVHEAAGVRTYEAVISAVAA